MKITDHATALKAIKARIEGAFDDPALLAAGTLSLNRDDDILRIVGGALAAEQTADRVCYDARALLSEIDLIAHHRQLHGGHQVFAYSDRLRRSLAATEAMPAAPDPYEAAARAAGWTHGGDGDGFIFHEPTWGHWKSAASWSGTNQEPNGKDDKPNIYDNWKECCEGEDIEATPAAD